MIVRSITRGYDPPLFISLSFGLCIGVVHDSYHLFALYSLWLMFNFIIRLNTHLEGEFK
jgi:hypothetical protein